jgi:hypothetical protein
MPPTPGSTHSTSSTDASTHRPNAKRKRRSNGDRISSALETIATTHRRRARRKAHTQTQTAIANFLKRYGISMSPEKRVQYVRYFIENPSGAEGFNVLDSTTQAAFLFSLGFD